MNRIIATFGVAVGARYLQVLTTVIILSVYYFSDREKTRTGVPVRSVVLFSIMAHFSCDDWSQRLLLPGSVDDYVGPDSVVGFIDAFVDGLDLQAAGFGRVHAKTTGRPGYDPADLLKLYGYGYLNRVRSSRRLEVETRRNIEVIWLLRRLAPDFKTIADFRRDNRSAFRQVFREFVVLCRKLGLLGREFIAVDGTRIKAVNSRERNFTKAKLAKAMAERDERPGVLDKRRESVEHPFGSVKQWMGQGAFLMRRLENVRAEFSLTAIAYNLRRAITLIGIPALIAAMTP